MNTQNKKVTKLNYKQLSKNKDYISKRSNQFIRQLREVDYSKLKKSQIRELVTKAFNALTDKEKSIVLGNIQENTKKTFEYTTKDGEKRISKGTSVKTRMRDIITEITNAINNTRDPSGYGPIELFATKIQHNKWESGLGDLETLYARFRTEAPQVYAKYNSYMYRNGYSASQWFLDNSHSSSVQRGSIVTTTVVLPTLGSNKRVTYTTLTVVDDKSKANESLRASME